MQGAVEARGQRTPARSERASPGCSKTSRTLFAAAASHRPAEKASLGLSTPHSRDAVDAGSSVLGRAHPILPSMSTIGRMSPLDLLSLNLTNLDPLTENYDLGFYLNYLTKWPSLFSTVKDRDAGVVGYIMGKLEEQHPSMRHSEHYTPWHGHITVLTVAPAWRRLGYARRLTEQLEAGSDINNAWFVDLYVRAGNKVAVDMYKGMGYSVFRRVVSYYSDDPTGMSESGEDAYDMRKPCSRDKKRAHVREKGEDFLVNPEDVS